MSPKVIRLDQLKYHWGIYFLLLPSLVFIGLFQYYPALLGITHSFFRWNGADINEYIGLGNYITLVKNPAFWTSFRVALVIGIWNIFKMVPAAAVAVCIHRARSNRMQFLYRILFVAPMVMPALVVVLIWRSFFFEATNGYLNQALIGSGIFKVLVFLDHTFNWGGMFQAGVKPAWLGDKNLILFACIVWGFPWVQSFAVLTHLAKLQGIPRELNEAGELDGVNWWTKFTRLELPVLSGSINILMVLVIIETIKDAGTILALAGMEGGPGGVVTVPALFMLREAFVDQHMGGACAVGIVLTIMVMALKKLLDAVSDWEATPARRKIAIRLAGLVCALIFYLYLHSTLIPLVLLVLVVPWRNLLSRLRFLFPQQPSPADPWQQTDAERAAAARYAALLKSPAYHFRRRLKDAALRTAKHGFVWSILAFAYLPLYLMLIVSVKSNTQFYDAPATITYPMHWDNWAQGWNAVIPSLANSIFITTASTALTLVLALGAAYFFARVKVPGSTFLWNAILLLMMMPTIANLIPLFRLLIDMNLQNTLSALVLVGAAGGQMFAIFVLREFVADLPQALFEAAELDGAGHLRQMFTIVAPLSGPILGVIGLMQAVGQWNDFVLPLIVMRDQSRLPVMVQLLRMAGEYIKHWGPLMAGYALASIPIIFLFIIAMRLFTQGLTEGAVKG